MNTKLGGPQSRTGDFGQEKTLLHKPGIELYKQIVKLHKYNHLMLH